MSNIGNQSSLVTRNTQVQQSLQRRTVDTSAGATFSLGASKVADTALAGVNLAAPFVPGGATLSAAITNARSAVSSMSSGLGTTSGAATSVGNNTALSSVGGTNASTGTTAVSGGNGDMMSQMQQMQEMNQSFNLQYLGLQQKMQDESRRFTMISNIMKTKHDTAKNSISNVR